MPPTAARLCFAVTVVWGLAVPALAIAQSGGDPGAGDAALARARELLADGQNDPAIAVLLRAVDHDPELTPGWVLLGNTELAMGRTERAITAYRRALDLEPRLRDVRYNLAYALRQAAQFKRAIRVYRVYLQTSPRDPDALFGLAESLKADTQWAAAADAFDAYAAAETRSNQARWIRQARADAVALRRRAAERQSNPELVEAPPDGPIPWSNRVEAATEVEAAAANVNASADIDPAAGVDDDGRAQKESTLGRTGPSPAASSRAPAFDDGLASLKNGHFDRALRHLTVAAEQSPNDPVVLSAIGSAQLGRGNARGAISAYRRALLRRPLPAMVPAIEFGIAEAHRLARDDRAAAAAFRRVVADPATPPQLVRLAEDRLATLRP